MILHYDGSVTGFFCLLGTAIKERLEIANVIRRGETTTADLFHQERQIETDSSWAAKVAAGLERALGGKFMTLLAQALLSELDGIELDLLTLTRRALHEGGKISSNLADPLVSWVQSAVLRSSREHHRLLGLLRFTQLADDSYLARIASRTNVIPLIGSHFAKRLGAQRWLIVDVKRKNGVLGEKSHWQVVEQIEISSDLLQHANEAHIANLWRSFYQSINNPQRYNPKLRQQFMPKHYWRYLTELQENPQ